MPDSFCNYLLFVSDFKSELREWLYDEVGIFVARWRLCNCNEANDAVTTW